MAASWLICPMGGGFAKKRQQLITLAQPPYDGLHDGRPECEMEFTLGQFILALVGSGAAFSLWTYLATQRFNAQEALRTAYIDYLAAIELVGRAKVKCQSAFTRMHELTRAFRKLADDDPSIQEHRSDLKQHVVAARAEVDQTNVDLFDTRAVVVSAKNTLRLLESDKEFDQRVQNLNMLLADLLEVKPGHDTNTSPVNQAAEALLLRVKMHHPRLAAHPWAVRWRRFWGKSPHVTP